MDNQVVITLIILLSVSLLFFLAYLNSKKIPEKKRSKIFEKLEEIKEQVNSPDSVLRRDAIIRLDNLLGRALNIKYGNDKSCGDNLKLAKKLFDRTNYQNLWDVHKLRNEIVHRDAEVSFEETKDAYSIYKMGIRKILK